MRTVALAVVPVAAQTGFLHRPEGEPLMASTGGDCPGGSLHACVDACMALKDQPDVFAICVNTCSERCSGPTPAPVPTPTPTPTPAPPPSPSPAPAPSPDIPGECSAFATESSNCDDCGACKNAGARAGVMCKGKGTGYYCSPDSPAAGDDMAFACMDWTFGSMSMKKQETLFKQRTGEDVFFGVGTFGTSDDVQSGLGACYRLQVDGVDKDLLLQSINTGSDVSGFQFDLQIGDGGAGLFNTCAGGSSPGHDSMFPGPYSLDTWGKQYGGVDTRDQCKNLPKYPAVDGAMKEAGDDLVSLCEWGFDHGVRGPQGENPSILSIGRVECPDELVHMTQIHRKDDPAGYAPSNPTVASHDCELNHGGTSLEWCLTRMMDCRKPSGGFIDNIHTEMHPGHMLVQPCTSDGYTRIDVQCGCSDCYC